MYYIPIYKKNKNNEYLKFINQLTLVNDEYYCLHASDKYEALELAKKEKQLFVYDDNYNKIYLSDYNMEIVYTLYELIKNKNGIVTDIKLVRQNKKLYKIKEYFKNTRQVYNYIYSSIDGVIDKVVKYDYIIIKDCFISE